jgi:cytoskeletal protein RodZ
MNSNTEEDKPQEGKQKVSPQQLFLIGLLGIVFIIVIVVSILILNRPQAVEQPIPTVPEESFEPTRIESTLTPTNTASPRPGATFTPKPTRTPTIGPTSTASPTSTLLPSITPALLAAKMIRDITLHSNTPYLPNVKLYCDSHPLNRLIHGSGSWHITWREPGINPLVMLTRS